MALPFDRNYQTLQKFFDSVEFCFHTNQRVGLNEIREISSSATMQKITSVYGTDPYTFLKLWRLRTRTKNAF